MLHIQCMLLPLLPVQPNTSAAAVCVRDPYLEVLHPCAELCTLQVHGRKAVLQVVCPGPLPLHFQLQPLSPS
jgi:hypothetical protein